MLQFDLITIFPSIFDSYLKESILGRAESGGFVTYKVHNLRDYTTDKHKTVDGSPYGGGAGMVMKVEPIFKAVAALKKKVPRRGSTKLTTSRSGHSTSSRVILLSAKGKQFTQAMAKKYSKLDRIIFICGRYEGVDERVAKYIADDEISVGPYVLTGGELPALTIVDAVTRLIPGVLGNKESLSEESYGSFGKSEIRNTKSETMQGIHNNKKEYPQYTRPEVYEPKKGVKWKVPAVLLSGDHKKIAEWRNERMY